MTVCAGAPKNHSISRSASVRFCDVCIWNMAGNHLKTRVVLGVCMYAWVDGWGAQLEDEHHVSMHQYTHTPTMHRYTHIPTHSCT